MCKIFEEHESQIKDYCEANKLDFDKLRKMSKAYNQESLAFLYFDKNKSHSNAGLNDETPLPLVLLMLIKESGLEFKQTQYTKQYLS